MKEILLDVLKKVKSSQGAIDQVDLPLFLPDIDDAQRWIQHVEEIMEEFCWSDAQTLVRVGRYLTDKSKDSSDDKSGVEDPVPSKKRKDAKAEEESKSERSKDRKHSKHKDSQEHEEKHKLKKHKHDSAAGSNSASPDDSKYKVSKKEKKSKGSEDSAEEDKSVKGNGKEKKSSGPKKPIPNIFKGIKLVIPQEEKENLELERHFVAYGGTVLDETDSELATHIVRPTKAKGDNQNHLKWSPEAKAVQLKWILHSIQLKELQDIEKYLIDSHVHGSDPL